MAASSVLSNALGQRVMTSSVPLAFHVRTGRSLSLSLADGEQSAAVMVSTQKTYRQGELWARLTGSAYAQTTWLMRLGVSRLRGSVTSEG